MVNRIWPTAVAGKADSVSSVSSSACHIGGPNSVNPSQILLVYARYTDSKMKSLLSERPKCLSVMSNELGISCQIHDAKTPDGAKYASVSRAFKDNGMIQMSVMQHFLL